MQRSDNAMCCARGGDTLAVLVLALGDALSAHAERALFVASVLGHIPRLFINKMLTGGVGRRLYYNRHRIIMRCWQWSQCGRVDVDVCEPTLLALITTQIRSGRR